MTEKYDVRIIMRDGAGQTKDDYRATVTRNSDGVELVWISDYRWLLKLKIRRKALDKHFRRYDKRQVKLAEVESISR